MSKSYRPQPESEFEVEDDDDEHEVIDVDYETVVYDDVDGHVVEPGNALPAPLRLHDEGEDDDANGADDGPSTALVVSAGDTMPFAMALDDLLTSEEALLDRAVARKPQRDSVDETRAGRVTSASMPARATADVAPRRAAAASTPTSAAAPPEVERTEAARMSADRRPIAAAPTPPAAKPGGQSPTPDESTADARGVVCPFCAHVRADPDEACPRCTMADTASTRRSTGERIGPWFVLQRKNPTAPGLRFSVLLKLARRGHVTARSIVRGPTTGQLWRYAGEVKGLSRVFGTCWHCRADLSPDVTTCPKCKSAQEIPDDPDVFLENTAVPLMTDAPAATAAGVVMREVAPADEPTPRRDEPPRPAPKPKPAAAAVDRPAPAFDARPPAKIAAAVGAKAIGEPTLSASELAAVFQLAPAVKPGRARRVGRRAWKLTKVAVVLAALTTAAGAATFYAKPEWREPARAWAMPIALEARDRAIVARDWTSQQSSDAWHATTAAIARWREPTPAAPVDMPTGPTVATSDAPAPNDATSPTDAPTPIRTDEASSPRTTLAAPSKTTPSVAEGQSSIVDATLPKPLDPAAAAERAKIAAQLDADQQTWESLMAAKASTKPAAAMPTDATAENATAANAPATATPGNAGPTSSADADQRAVDLALATNAAIAEAEHALAQSKAAASATTSTPPTVTPTRPQQPQTPPAVTPNQSFTPTVTLDDALTRAVTLRQKAFDAQDRGDWAEAVKIYQEIGKLPEAARPSDLAVRLRIAQDHVRKQ